MKDAGCYDGAMTTEATRQSTTSTTTATPTDLASKEVQAPKEGVSDAVKQAYLEDQKDKSKT